MARPTPPSPIADGASASPAGTRRAQAAGDVPHLADLALRREGAPAAAAARTRRHRIDRHGLAAEIPAEIPASFRDTA